MPAPVVQPPRRQARKDRQHVATRPPRAAGEGLVPARAGGGSLGGEGGEEVVQRLLLGVLLLLELLDLGPVLLDLALLPAQLVQVALADCGG